MAEENDILKIWKEEKSVVGITGSPSTTIDIVIDIKEESKLGRILGQMVHFIVKEDEADILVIGQVISIKTENRWHQDPTFKGIIRLHGSLPHLSERADNRIAEISVQAAYKLEKEPETHILGTSPSTGKSVKKMSNDLMNALMAKYEKHITYMGKVYGTDVDLPFWFKHFDKGEGGAGDAHHIGVFGKSGSGKSVTAAYMMLGYAKNYENMNILVLDPQKQFYHGKDFPAGFNFADRVKSLKMNFDRYQLLQDLFLPGIEFEIFSSLLQKNRFIQSAFGIKSDREHDAAIAISDYLHTRYNASKGKDCNLNKLNLDTSRKLMFDTLKKFTDKKPSSTTNSKQKLSDYNRYVQMIYSQKSRIDQMIDKITRILDNQGIFDDIFNTYWHPIVKYFISKDENGNEKKPIDYIIKKISDENEKGNFIILDISGESEKIGSENIKALFVKLIENKIKEAGERFYSEGKKVNCLIVMDEAHRFISHESDDPQIKELTKEIIDSVRTTRKYGIGYMFITQTIESLDKEILQQTRIFGFGYGLTLGTEIRVIENIVNSKSAIQLYKSFIDPSSSGRYPFMFYGSISPLSFTGAPLFLEVYTDPEKFE